MVYLTLSTIQHIGCPHLASLLEPPTGSDLPHLHACSSYVVRPDFGDPPGAHEMRRTRYGN
jgi:hypothetical protein